MLHLKDEKSNFHPVYSNYFSKYLNSGDRIYLNDLLKFIKSDISSLRCCISDICGPKSPQLLFVLCAKFQNMRWRMVERNVLEYKKNIFFVFWQIEWFLRFIPIKDEKKDFWHSFLNKSFKKHVFLSSIIYSNKNTTM